MKKFFSLIALVGAIAACTPEQVETAFKLNGGKITVLVDVRDVINGGTYNGTYNVTAPDITGLTKSQSGAHGETIVYTADVSKQVAPVENATITVSGPNLAKDYTSSSAIPAVLAGGEAVIKVVVPVGEPLNGYTIDVTEGDVDRWEVKDFLVNEDYEKYAYSYNGIDEWYYNNTEYKLEADVEYSVADYAVINDPRDNNYLGFEGIVRNVESAYTAGYEWNDEPFQLHFNVSAWAMWNVLQTTYHTAFPVTVNATKGNEKLVLGTFGVEYVNKTKAEPFEIAYPLAAGHYVHGYGHDAHGSMPNAGGGMSMND